MGHSVRHGIKLENLRISVIRVGSCYVTMTQMPLIVQSQVKYRKARGFAIISPSVASETHITLATNTQTNMPLI